MSIQVLSRHLALAGIEHVVVTASKKAMDYDIAKLKSKLSDYKKLSRNDLDYVWTRNGGVQLVTRDDRRKFSPEIKTASELDKYLNTLLKSTAQEEATARSAAPRRVKLHFKTSSERLAARREAKRYRQAHKSELKRKAKLYRMKMKHKKPNKILSDRAKMVHKHFHH